MRKHYSAVARTVIQLQGTHGCYQYFRGLNLNYILSFKYPQRRSGVIQKKRKEYPFQFIEKRKERKRKWRLQSMKVNNSNEFKMLWNLDELFSFTDCLSD